MLDTRAAYGTCNLTGSGEPASCADIARAVYRLTGPARVTPVSTAEDFANAISPAAPRPTNSTLKRTKIEAAVPTQGVAKFTRAECC